MRSKTDRNQGAVLVMVAVCMSLFFILLAIAIDIGYMHATKAELQHAADSAALAGAFDLAGETPDPVGLAQEYAGYNQAAKVSLDVPSEDVTVGWMENPIDLHSEIETESGHDPNSVEVTTRRSSTVNGPLDLFLGAFTGLDSVNIATRARAVLERRIIGFDAPEGGGEQTVSLMPFSVLIDDWNDKIVNGNGEDTFTFTLVDDDSGTVTNGADTVPEIKMYPYPHNQGGNNPPGNFGTVDIGPGGNSTNDLVRQILHGISDEDLDAIDGELDGEGRLILSEEDEITHQRYILLEGDTGLSNAIKDALEKIIGHTRTILLHSEVQNPGNNAIFKIVGFERVVILEVHMTGNPKWVKVQPNGDTGNSTGTGVFAPDAPVSGTLFMVGLTR